MTGAAEPDCTSSAISSVPVFAVTSATAFTNPSGRLRTPSPRIGSAMMAAVVSLTAARRVSGFSGFTKVTGPMSGMKGSR